VIEAPNLGFEPKLDMNCKPSNLIGWLECCFKVNKDVDPGTCCIWRNHWLP